MKVVILCGGRGTRIKEETEFKPKPMVEVGGMPILWHIMRNYAHYAYKDFILCLGYKGRMIKEYFLNYHAMNNDFTVMLGAHNQVKIHGSHRERDWSVTLVDTGEESKTGTRVKRVEKYIDGDMFMLTYGDGVADMDIKKLVEFHKSHGKIGTVTGVHPSSRFGELSIEDNRVLSFSEKPQMKMGLFNGGFFVFSKKFFKYLSPAEDQMLELEPLEKLAADDELRVYRHDGFWQCVDTYRELELLNNLWKTRNPPWKIWKD